jgi:hypothetical protein
MAQQTTPCLGTRGVTFEPKVERVYYQSVSASSRPPYQGFSSEELRLADYIQMGKLQPEQNAILQTTRSENSTSTGNVLFAQNAVMKTAQENESASTTNASWSQIVIMKTEPADESRPTTTTTFLKEWREVESGHYEYILDVDPAAKPRVVLPAITNGIINTSTVRQLQDKLEKAESELKKLKEDAVQHEKTPQSRLEAQMEELLRSEVDVKMTELREALQKLILRDLSPDQVTALLEHPMVMAKVDERLSAARAEETAKLEAEIQQRVEMAKKQLSEAEIGEILTSNTVAVSIFERNLNKRLEIEKARLTATLKAEIEEKLRSAEDVANTKRSTSVVSEEKKPAVPWTVTFPASPNDQTSFRVGTSRLTTPFGYPVTALGSSSKPASPAVFGESWKPRTPLQVLSSSPPSANLSPKSDHNAKLMIEGPSSGKRNRDTDDVGGSKWGPKKFCLESKE